MNEGLFQLTQLAQFLHTKLKQFVQYGALVPLPLFAKQRNIHCFQFCLASILIWLSELPELC